MDLRDVFSRLNAQVDSQIAAMATEAAPPSEGWLTAQLRDPLFKRLYEEQLALEASLARGERVADKSEKRRELCLMCVRAEWFEPGDSFDRGFADLLHGTVAPRPAAPHVRWPIAEVAATPCVLFTPVHVGDGVGSASGLECVADDAAFTDDVPVWLAEAERLRAAHAGDPRSMAVHFVCAYEFWSDFALVDGEISYDYGVTLRGFVDWPALVAAAVVRVPPIHAPVPQ